ncbi:MAG: MmcQ/YjbR family DNA-binding protein [Silvibacterium sp.]
MTANEFRRLALDLPEAVESAHMNHPDFRVRGKIFATLSYPDKSFGMVKLSLPDQLKFTQADSMAFTPVPGAWGEHGSTHVLLKMAKKQITGQALLAAWKHAAPKDLHEQTPAQDK